MTVQIAPATNGPPADATAERATGPSRRRALSAALIVAGMAVVMAPVAASVRPALLVLAVIAVALVAIAYVHPPAAAYILLGATPLTAGFARDAFVPLLRPHEALAFALGAGVALRALVQLCSGHKLPLRLRHLDVAILSMAVTSSVLPLLWMLARGVQTTQEDLLYASAIWKFYGLFVLIRASVRTERQVMRCLQVSIAAAAVVAVMAALQSMQLAGVPALLEALYPPEAGGAYAAGRGSATLGSPIAVGDLMAFNLAICLAWLRLARGSRWLMVGLALLFALGGLASGQFSGVIAVVVAVVAVAALTGQVKRLLLALVPTILLSAILLRPVAEERLANLDLSTGLPQSWTVRLRNLRDYVWPDVSSGHNWLFGVRPSARIVVDAPWGPIIYIESGHTWLLWTGGIPFFAAFLFFMWVAVGTTASIGRHRRGPIGVAAIASFASLLIVFVLMSFDPHITMRGTADLLFSLLALATVQAIADRPGASLLSRPAQSTAAVLIPAQREAPRSP